MNPERSKPTETRKKEVMLLSGGNPQIPKGDGDVPVREYLDAMPGWKREVGERLDTLVTDLVPEVRKAVRWNSPFYGVEGQGWFLSFHVFTGYVKVTFFNGISLDPLPDGHSEKSGDSRWHHLHEGDFDVALLARWIRQAAALPGWDPKGKEPASKKEQEPMPEELVRKLAEDPELKAAFEALTPGRRRGYLLHISGAKQSKTRAARVEKWRSRILEGKGMHDR